MLYHQLMKYLPLLIMALLLSGCPKKPQVPVAPPPPPPGPTPIVRDTDKCQQAHDNLVELQCMNPNNTPMWENADGEPFVETCRRLQDHAGIFVNPQCVADAATCQEADICPPSSD